jgi:4-alpha-glucanotransferase
MAQDALRALAELCGVELAYDDDQGRRRQASDETLLAVLKVLGVPLQRPADAREAFREQKQLRERRALEPVLVAWDGKLAAIPLRLPAREAGTLSCRLEMESGEVRFWSCAVSELPVVERTEVEGVAYHVHLLHLPNGSHEPGPLPLGYHRLVLNLHQPSWECTLVAAPVTAYAPQKQRTWGLFLPVYAIRSERDWGAGDFTDLEQLITWTQAHGGGLVGTLPLLAAFLNEQAPSGANGAPFEYSPYSPASRLFWNEFFIDVARAPELAHCPEAQNYLNSHVLREELTSLRREPLVDYPRVMAAKRHALNLLARSLFQGASGRLPAYQAFLQKRPRVLDYAAFRATIEKQQTSWWSWPERLRAGTLHADDYDEEARRYHTYVQWLAEEQLAGVAARAQAAGPGLYLDFPLGVNSDSYDVWRERSSFALGVSAGAPPDLFFTRGQDWGFPPLHPEHTRTQGHRYLRACLAHQLEHAGVLRIDHMMGLHRFYWVPHELGPKHGAYVRYPVEELYAIFVLESNRHRTVLIGEDLGTVPPAVRPAMLRHRVHRLYVAQYELRPDSAAPFPPVPEGALASVNTHDMPTFAAYWQALDVADRQEMGLMDEAEGEQERQRRQAIRAAVVAVLRRAGLLGEQDEEFQDVLRALLCWMARSPSQGVLANLEDLWQATAPQNVPGTWRDRPNWRRKAAHTLEQLEQIPGLVETLRALDQTVRAAGEPRT